MTTITLITDEDGIFHYEAMPYDGISIIETYLLEIIIEAENCTSLLSYRMARELEGNTFYIGDTFILD
ncbi:MAG TPA: hypothetical protein PLZ51_23550, partial [Aggregatilineales bacterium]|nr:hypothetical protein [Aggregatilineales bacterium]